MQRFLFERVIGVIAAIVILSLVVFIVIRNEPFTDSNTVVIVRTMIALACAIFASSISGFLNVQYSFSGLVVRAGAGFAVFVLAFFFTPTVLPTNNEVDKKLPSLQNERIILNERQNARVQAFVMQNILVRPAVAQKIDESTSKIVVLRATTGDLPSMKGQQKFFDIYLRNVGTEDRILLKLHAKWVYVRGTALSIERAEAIVPSLQYSIPIVIRSYNVDSVTMPMTPPLAFGPSREGSSPTDALRLEVNYQLQNPSAHPALGWDIAFVISAEDDAGQRVRLVCHSWNERVARDRLIEFCDQHAP